MKIKLTLNLLALVAVCLNTHATESTSTTPLPEFMDQQQLAKWNDSRGSAKISVTANPELTTQFYSGKPYVADAGGYLFEYRTYNPELSRWTTADSSGFPDGVNNFIYVKDQCINSFDKDGLVTQTFTDNGGDNVVMTVILTQTGSGSGNIPTVYGESQLSGPSSVTIGVATASISLAAPSSSNPGNVYLTGPSGQGSNVQYTPASGSTPQSYSGDYVFQVTFSYSAGFSGTFYGQKIGAAVAGTQTINAYGTFSIE